MPTYAFLPSSRCVIVDPAFPYNRSVSCGTVSQSGGWTEQLDGEIVYYAGGLVGAQTYEQDIVTRAITLRHLSAPDVQVLRGWRGRTILFRFADGEKLFGTYFQISVKPLYQTTPADGDLSNGNLTFDVDLSISRVSYSEAV